MKRLVITMAIAGTASACNGAREEIRIMDMSCGAVMGSVDGNAELLMREERERRKDPTKVYPQIVVERAAIWGPGANVRVAFLDGDSTTRKFVMDVAREWLDGLNLRFSESADADAEIRVTFTGKGVWSKVGKHALSVSHGSPTMGLAGLLQSSDPALRRAYVLHEFGHALGAVHEHQRPDAPLTWIPKVVNAHYLALYGWSEGEVYEQVMRPLNLKPFDSSPEFDRMSVMMYPIHKEFTKEGFVQAWNSQLTNWDRTVMAILYN